MTAVLLAARAWRSRLSPPNAKRVTSLLTAKPIFIRYTFLLTDESLSSLAKMVPDLLDYTDGNGIIDYAGDVNAQLYALFEVDDSMKRLILRTLEENQS